MSYKIMISYTWRNSAERSALVGHIRSIEGVEILYDRQNIDIGSEIHKGIDEMLLQANCLIALLTPEALASKEVLDEITRANDRGIKILPIVAQDVEMTSLPWYLKDVNFIPYRPTDFDSVLSSTEIAIRNLSTKTRNRVESPTSDDEEKKMTLDLFDKLIHGGENFLIKMIDDIVRIQRSGIEDSRKLRRLRIYIETELEQVQGSVDEPGKEQENPLTGIGMALISRSVKLKSQALKAAMKVLDLRKDDLQVDDVFDEVKETVHYFLVDEQSSFLKQKDSD